jgi:hypothetical protein
MRDIDKIANRLALNTLVFHGRKFEEAFADEMMKRLDFAKETGADIAITNGEVK